MERESNASVNKVRHNKPPPRRHHFKPRGGQRFRKLYRPKQTTTCWNCWGPFPHRNNHCPAKDKTCYACKNTGHLEKMCRSKDIHKPSTMQVKAIDSTTFSQNDSDSDYCYGIRTQSEVNSLKGPFVKAKLNDCEVKLLVDSGSSVDILDETTHRRIGKPKLRKGKMTLTPYGGKGEIKVIGTCDLAMETSRSYSMRQFHVVEGEGGSLLGYPTANQLKILTVVNKIYSIYMKMLPRKFQLYLPTAL